MKKLVSAIVLSMFIALLAGCSSQQSAPASNQSGVPSTAAVTAAAAPTEVPSTAAPTAAASQTESTIDLEKAKAAALADAGFEASQVQFTKQGLDTDDGIQKYEIEFTVGGYEYEYVIDPKTGAVMKKSKELIGD